MKSKMIISLIYIPQDIFIIHFEVREIRMHIER